MKDKGMCPCMSRKQHDKKMDSPKGDMISDLLIKPGVEAESQFQAATKAKLDRMKQSIL